MPRRRINQRKKTMRISSLHGNAEKKDQAKEENIEKDQSEQNRADKEKEKEKKKWMACADQQKLGPSAWEFD